MFRFFTEMFNKIYTAFRRINHPEIKKGDLVIDVGCGGQPYPGAHVLCDYFLDDLERADSLRIDRPFVWADAEKLPFKDKAFDYSIASHILEHVENPSSVLIELSRVSKAGYIETPSAFYEYAVPHPYHVSRCSVIEGKFVVVMKDVWNQQLDGRYFDLQNELRRVWNGLAVLNTLELMTIYKWKDHIEFEIHGETSIRKSIELMESVSMKIKRSFIRKLVISLTYFLMRPRPSLELMKVLACPICHGELKINGMYESATCGSCNVIYPSYEGYLDFRLISNKTNDNTTNPR
jgi:ubiquinone/menaquinone biosynthesis C-methylase UbiE